MRSAWAIVVLSIVAGVGVCGRAAEAGAALTVSPMVVEMQAKPGIPERVIVAVSNPGDSATHVQIVPMDWRTQVNGNVVMQRPAENPHSLVPYLALSEYTFTLAPHEHRALDLTLTMPATVANGSTWGGFFVKATEAGASAQALGPASTLVVYNNVGAPSKHLDLEAMRVVADATGHARLLAKLQNDGQSYLRVGAKLTITKNGRVVDTRTVGVGAIFPGDHRIVDYEIGSLPSGAYTFDVLFDFGTDTLVDGETHTLVR